MYACWTPYRGITREHVVARASLLSSCCAVSQTLSASAVIRVLVETPIGRQSRSGTFILDVVKRGPIESITQCIPQSFSRSRSGFGFRKPHLAPSRSPLRDLVRGATAAAKCCTSFARLRGRRSWSGHRVGHPPRTPGHVRACRRACRDARRSPGDDAPARQFSLHIVVQPSALLPLASSHSSLAAALRWPSPHCAAVQSGRTSRSPSRPPRDRMPRRATAGSRRRTGC